MEFYKVSKNSNGVIRRSSIISNGPIASIIGLILSILILIISGIALVFTISDSKYESYKTIVTVSEIKNEILDGETITTYILKYEINGIEYNIEEDALFLGEYEIGSTISANYNPNTMQIVSYGNSSDSGMFLISILVLIVACIFSIVRNFNNFMHFLKPDQYSLIGDSESESHNLENQHYCNRTDRENDESDYIRL